MNSKIKENPYIKISGFKSVGEVVIGEVKPFFVIAGPNGSGKSNFFDALCFLSSMFDLGVKKSADKFGGVKAITCKKKKGLNRNKVSFEILWPSKMDGKENDIYQAVKYILNVSGLDGSVKVTERIFVNEEVLLQRDAGTVKVASSASPRAQKFQELYEEYLASDDNSKDKLILPLFASFERSYALLNFLKIFRNVKKLQIDPNSARSFNKYDENDENLLPNAGNLSAVLQRIKLEKPDAAMEIIDALSSVVPSIKGVDITDREIDGSMVFGIKEHGYKSVFPPGLISDGTIYLLSLISSIYCRGERYGIQLVEEPERGLHPMAVQMITEMFKESSSWENPVFMTTHSETVIRTCKIEDIVFFNKRNGLTTSSRPEFISDEINIPLDEAWLTNMLNGGLPE